MILIGFLMAFLIVTILSFFTGKYAKQFSLISVFILTVIFVIYSFSRFATYTGGIISKSNILLSSFTANGISIRINFSTGLTGFTDALVIMALMVTIFALLIGEKSNDDTFFGLLTSVGFGLVGLFMVRNFLFFYIFWEVVLVPMFFVIGKYGSYNKDKISIKFFIYTHVGSLFLLLSIFTLSTYYFIKTGIFTFQISDLMNLTFQETLPKSALYFSFFGFLLAFLIKLPTFPLHEWLPNAHYTAPYSGSILLSGGLLSMGGYGLLGILYPVASLFPLALVYFLIALGLISVVYFAFTSMFQKNLKRMIAYSSAGEMAFVTIAFGTSLLSTGYVRTLDLSGGMYQTIAHAFVTSLAFSSLYFIYKRTHTIQVYGLGGLYHKTPVASSFFLAALLASLGLPTLAGFIGEFSVTIASYQSIGLLTLLIVFGLIVTAAYFIWAAQRSLFGFYNESLGKLKDLDRAEFLILFLMLASSIFIGIYPTLIFRLLSLYATHIGGLI